MKQGRSSVWFALSVLFAINAMNFFDRQILGAVGETVRREWGLSDGALGALGTAFTLLYAFAGVPLGRLADVSRRRWILSAGVFVWSRHWLMGLGVTVALVILSANVLIRWRLANLVFAVLLRPNDAASSINPRRAASAPSDSGAVTTAR